MSRSGREATWSHVTALLPPNEDLFREDEGRECDNAADNPDGDDDHEVHHLAGLRGEGIDNHLHKKELGDFELNSASVEL